MFSRTLRRKEEDILLDDRDLRRSVARLQSRTSTPSIEDAPVVTS
jgi:hypothetical protein